MIRNYLQTNLKFSCGYPYDFTEPDLYISIDQDIIANTTNSRGDNNQLRHKIFLLLFHYSY